MKTYNTELKNLVQELRARIIDNDDFVYKKIMEIKRCLYKIHKRSITVNDVYNEISDVMTYQQVLYHWNIQFASKEMLKHVTPKGFARLCYANNAFIRHDIQEKMITLIKNKKFKWSVFGKTKTPSNYVKELIPELQTQFDNALPIIETIYAFKSMLQNIKKHYSKLSEFNKMRLDIEYKMFREEMDNKIKNIKYKNIWILKRNSRSGFDRAKKYFKNAERSNPATLELVVTKDDLLNNVDKLRRFHCKII